MQMRRLLAGILAATVLACSSGTASTTSVDAPVTTASAPVATADPGSVGSMSDMPAECVSAFRSYLQAIEPIVEGVDFESATQADFEALSAQFEAATGDFEEETATCPELDLTAEESYATMIEFAEDEAPGTVAYFEFIQGFIGNIPTGVTGVTGSGDCETDIAAMQELVDRGGTVSDLTVAEGNEVTELLVAIGSSCSPARLNEFLAKEDVAAYLFPGG